MSDFGLNKEDNKQRRNRGNEDSWHCQFSHKHGRSKSASSERDLQASSDEVSQSAKNFTRMQTSSVQTIANKRPKALHNRQILKKNPPSNDRASLERDVEQLHLRLQQEKSMRLVLEKAMGRASSSLSPGHRHFSAQAKELITEIELLEAEVANRELHVLSLYRSIFEETISRASSEQSSVISSPAHHIKQPPRKHPSVISDAFCSSNNFPLKPWQAMVTFKDLSRKTSKKDHSSQFRDKNCIPSITSCSGQAKSHSKDSVTEKNPSQRTLKDHLYQCPSKLSEEMVKCMASVYFWLCSSSMSEDPEKRKRNSPTLSRSATSNVVIPKNVMSEDRVWSCRSMVEVSWISSNKRRFSQASYAINNYRLLVEQLERVSINHLKGNAKLAFWINIYNALLMHAYLAYGVPANSLRRLALFHKSAYNIGGHIINANTIEYSIFCFQTPRNGRWLENIISTALRKKPTEDKVSSKFGLDKTEPLLCFALCTGALSDPVLKAYTATNVKEELEASKREFLRENVVVKTQKKVFLPKIIERFTKEASLSSDDLIRWLVDNVDVNLGESIQKCVESKKNNKKASQVVAWLPCSSRFCYIFSKGLMEKRPLVGLKRYCL